jgi:hypothetical protein
VMRTSEVPGSEPLASALSLQLLDAPTSVVSGSLVPVTFQLRNDSCDRLVLMRSAHVDVVLVDAGGIAVTDAGWFTAAGVEHELGPGDVVVLRDELSVLGPRGGAVRVPLPAGRYRLRGGLRFVLVAPNLGSGEHALETTAADLEVVALPSAKARRYVLSKKAPFTPPAQGA